MNIVKPTAPRCAVLVPTVRLDDLLDVAVASVLQQTMSDLEVVVILDGCAPGADRPPWWNDPRVSVLTHRERRGTATALNAGIDSTSAPVVARLDADDVAEPQRLELQLAALDEHADLDGIGSAATVIDERGAVLGRVDAVDQDTAATLLVRNPFVHSSMTLRRSALERVGGYDPRCQRMQDYDLWLRMSLEGSLGNLPQPLVRYRVHGAMHSRRTHLFSTSTRTVLASRRRLARRRGESPLRQATRDTAWLAGQAMLTSGLRRPRYLGVRPDRSRAGAHSKHSTSGASS